MSMERAARVDGSCGSGLRTFAGGSGLRRIAQGVVEEVALSTLLPADSPRVEGEDADHVRALAELECPLPPVIVHRPTMRVIDGMHRVHAATLRGESQIRVVFFDGSPEEAFVRAVQSNSAHGLPLSQADKSAAARRILESFPQWSN